MIILKKNNILKNNRDFDRIIKNNIAIKSKSYIIYKEETDEKYHFGISVSKKLGNAVLRNKLKRQIKNIIDSFIINDNFNCIIILRKNILNLNFFEKKNELYNELLKIKVIKENKNEK